MLCAPSSITCLSAYSTLLSAFSTIVMGFIVAYIAWQQKEIARQQKVTAQNKLRFDLFHPRHALYEAAMDFIGGISDVVKEAERRKFVSVMLKSKWFFNPDIEEYLKEILHHADRINYANEELKGVTYGPNIEREKLREKINESSRWLRDQMDKGLEGKLDSVLRISAE